jgi:hypothetical protein
MTRSGRSSPPEASATSWPQQLVPAGETVFDVPPLLASRVRVLGSGRSQKNDPNDASSVAIAALRSHRVPRQELWVHGDDVRHARGEALEPSPGASRDRQQVRPALDGGRPPVPFLVDGQHPVGIGDCRTSEPIHCTLVELALVGTGRGDRASLGIDERYDLYYPDDHS